MTKSATKEKSTRTKFSRSRSICLSCALAYGHLCFSVPFAERDWVTAYEERMYAGSHGSYAIRAVVGCNRFQYSGGRRVPLAPVTSRWEILCPDSSMLL